MSPAGPKCTYKYVEHYFLSKRKKSSGRWQKVCGAGRAVTEKGPDRKRRSGGKRRIDCHRWGADKNLRNSTVSANRQYELEGERTSWQSVDLLGHPSIGLQRHSVQFDSKSLHTLLLMFRRRQPSSRGRGVHVCSAEKERLKERGQRTCSFRSLLQELEYYAIVVNSLGNIASTHKWPTCLQ